MYLSDANLNIVIIASIRLQATETRPRMVTIYPQNQLHFAAVKLGSLLRDAKYSDIVGGTILICNEALGAI